MENGRSNVMPQVLTFLVYQSTEKRIKSNLPGRRGIEYETKFEFDFLEIIDE